MKKILMIIGFVGFAGVGMWLVWGGNTLEVAGGLVPKMLASGAAPATDAQGMPYVVPVIQNEYRNEQYGFALGLPDGFNSQELANDEGGQTVVLQDARGNGIQIHVTPYPDDTRSLSADDVRASIPDMQVSGEQPVEIGADHTGVAFMSDNEAFEGASREVWFIFRGNLYQISTYARLDALLQAMFGTWKFL
jgi:hypothetical protein